MAMQVSSKYIGLLIISITFAVHKSSICNAKCFVRRLNCQEKDECCCDKPSMQTTFNNIPSNRAFVSCSYICSSNNQCLAFNFDENSKICEMFYDEPLKCFKNVYGCRHMYLPEAVYRNLTIGADDRIVALYIDGMAQQRMPNWNSYNTYDSYIVPFNIKLVAIHAHNSITGRSILAFSNDGSIQSDTTWKCSPSTPTLDSNNKSWYNVDYDDSSWLSAVDQYPGSPLMGVMRIWLEKKSDMYCRKKLCD